MTFSHLAVVRTIPASNTEEPKRLNTAFTRKMRCSLHEAKHGGELELRNQHPHQHDAFAVCTFSTLGKPLLQESKVVAVDL